MEIIISVFSVAVAMSCLIAVVKSDMKDKKRTVMVEAQTAEFRS